MKIAARVIAGIAIGLLAAPAFAPAFAQVPPGAKLNQTGQSGPNTAPVEYSRPRQVISPIIHPDHTVTLKLAAPGASEVRATGHIIGMNAHWLSNPRKSIPMTKDANGVLSATLDRLRPTSMTMAIWSMARRRAIPATGSTSSKCPATGRPSMMRKPCRMAMCGW